MISTVAIVTKNHVSTVSKAIVCWDSNDVTQTYQKAKSDLQEAECLYMDFYDSLHYLEYLIIEYSKIIMQDEYYITMSEHQDEKHAHHSFGFSDKVSDEMTKHGKRMAQYREGGV